MGKAHKMALQRLPETAFSTGRVKFLREDFRSTDLSKAFAVFMFLPMHVSDYVLREVLPESSLQTGTPVYVCGKQDWRPAPVDDGGDQYRSGKPVFEHVESEDVGNSSFGSLH